MKKINELFFKSIILLICSYQLDINKTYKSFLTRKKIKQCLKKYNVRNEIIGFSKKYDLTGKFYYLRNTADSECMILVNGNNLYLIFCGTQFDLNDKVSLVKDLWTDISLGFDMLNEYGENIGIHHTYKKNMHCENLIGQIEKIFIEHNDYDITICGHSMGCGLGTYCALYFGNKYKNINFNLVLISSPKIGNIDLKNYLYSFTNIKLYSMINNNEIVPLFPFNLFFYNYININKNVWKYNSDGTIEIIDELDLSIFKSYSIKDHFTNAIIGNIYNSFFIKKNFS